jgi:hypothetical protein
MHGSTHEVTALVYNLPLVEWHRGQNGTTTSVITEDELTAEFLAFRRLVLPLVPKNRNPPSLKSAEGKPLNDNVVLYDPRSVEPGTSVVCHIGEGHLGCKARGDIYARIESVE